MRRENGRMRRLIVFASSLLWLGALVISFGLAGCGIPPKGIEVKGQRVEVIDMHLHTGEWKLIPPETQRYLASRFPFPFKLNPGSLADSTLTAEGILTELDKAGIQAAVLLAVYAPKTVGITPNEYVIAQIKKEPKRLFGMASLRVDRWNQEKDQQLKKLEDALKVPGMIGVKLAHAHMHFRMDDPRYYGIYDVAGRLDKPVYIHTGSSPFPNISMKEPYTNPKYLEDAIKKNPKANFILGHLGFDFVNKKHKDLDECLRLAKTYKNVYLEPSALGSNSGDPDGIHLLEAMRKIKKEGLISRIIYGSDGPQSPGFVKDYMERTLRAMEGADYTLEEIKAAFAGNFRKLYKVKAESGG